MAACNSISVGYLQIFYRSICSRQISVVHKNGNLTMLNEMQSFVFPADYSPINDVHHEWCECDKVMLHVIMKFVTVFSFIWFACQYVGRHVTNRIECETGSVERS